MGGRIGGDGLLTLAVRSNPTLQLWAFAVNVPAIEFYQRRGFRIVERTEGEGNEAKRPDVRMRSDARDGMPKGGQAPTRIRGGASVA